MIRYPMDREPLHRRRPSSGLLAGRVLVAAALFGIVAADSAAASASVLPVVVDPASESGGWWVDDPARAAGPFDEALFELAEGGDSRWLSPRSARSDVRISRIYRTRDMTPNNAIALGSLFGVTHVLAGTVTYANSDVPWLGLRSTTVTLDATLLDVASGAAVSVVRLTRTAHAASGSEAAAAEELARAAAELGTVSARSRDAAGGPTEGVVTVHSHVGAAPFVSLRAALREAHPGVVDVVECWATEGAVALRLELDEGTTFSDITPGIGRLEGVTLDGGVVRSVREMGGGLLVVVVPGAPTDAATP